MLMQMPPPSLPGGRKQERKGRLRHCDTGVREREKESLVALRSLDLAQTADFHRASLRVISMGNISPSFYCLPLLSEITSILKPTIWATSGASDKE